MKECFICFGRVVKNGLSKTKKQQFYCKQCKKSFTEGVQNKEAIKKQVLTESAKMQSLRQIAKTYSVSPSTILNWLSRMTNLKNYIEVEQSVKLEDLKNHLKSKNINANKGILIVGETILLLEV